MRTLRQGAVAGFINNPINQIYMMYVGCKISAYCIPKRFIGSLLAQNITLAFMHFAVMAPFTITIFILLTSYLKEQSKQYALENWSLRFMLTYKLAACYWPFFNFVAYHFAPFHLRYLCFDIFSLVYAIGLSLINNRVMKQQL